MTTTGEASPPGSLTLPQSAGQERLWFLHAVDPTDCGYHVYGAYRLRGALDTGRMRGALSRVIARHPALRARFPLADEPTQVIDADGRAALEVVEAVGDPAGGITAWLRRPFDLDDGPVIRAAIWCLGPEDHVLALCLHHIVCDHQSWSTVVGDLAAFYADPEAFVDGPEQLREYARSVTRDHLAGRAADELPPGLLARPFPQPALPGPGRDESRHGSAHLDVELPAADVEALQRAARAGDGLSATAVHLGLAAGLIAFLGDTDEAVLVSPVTTRELDSAAVAPVGCFVNLALLRIDVFVDEPVRQLGLRARDALLGAVRFRALPYQRVVAGLRDSGRIRGAQVPFAISFNHLLDGDVPPDFPGLTTELFPCDPLALRHPLALTIGTAGGRTTLRVSWDRARVSSRAAGALATTYAEALRELRARPYQSLHGVLAGTPLARLPQSTR